MGGSIYTIQRLWRRGGGGTDWDNPNFTAETAMLPVMLKKGPAAGNHERAWGGFDFQSHVWMGGAGILHQQKRGWRALFCSALLFLVYNVRGGAAAVLATMSVFSCGD